MAAVSLSVCSGTSAGLPIQYLMEITMKCLRESFESAVLLVVYQIPGINIKT